MVDFILPNRLNKKEDSFKLPNNLKPKILPIPTNSFDSTSSEPQEEKGFLSKYVGTPISSAVFGVGAGAERAIEGVTTLGTIMIDAGLGTELTAKVQKKFDENKIFNYLEDKADDSWTGIVTSALVQFGVPGGAALKVANGVTKAAKAGSFASRRPNVVKAGIAGVAELGAATEDMGTFGDLIGMGYTQTEDSEGEKGRADAFRRLRNKFRFGVEGALGFTLLDNVVFPLVGKAGKAALPGLKNLSTDLKYKGNPTKLQKTIIETDPVTGKRVSKVVGKETYTEIDPVTGKEVTKVRDLEIVNPGFQFNKNNILRWFDEKILAPLRPRGNLPQEVFDANRTKIDKLRSVTEKVRNETLELDKAVQKVVDENVGGWKNQLDKVGVRERENIMESIYDYLISGSMRSTDELGKVIPGQSKSLDELTAGLNKYTEEALNRAKAINKKAPAVIPPKLLPHIDTIRRSIDQMSSTLKEMPDIGFKRGKEFKEIVAANVGEYLTRSYRMYGTKQEKFQWLNTLNNTAEGQSIKQRAKDFIKYQDKDNPLPDDVVESTFESILQTNRPAQLDETFIKVKDIDDSVEKVRQQLSPEIRDLLGEVKDPISQYYKAAAKINTYIEDTKFMNAIKQSGNNKYFFEENPTLTKDLAEGNPSAKGEGGLQFNKRIESEGPLNGFYTTENIAKALENISDSKINADKLSGLYQKLFLVPKAFTQEAKTTLSPITHARNLISAASFTGMNGNFFRSPSAVYKDFKEAYRMTKAIAKNQLESQVGRSLFKDDGSYREFADQYRRMQELGVVNTSARLGDLKASLDEISSGMQNLEENGKIFTMLRGWGDKTGINKLRGMARLAYQTEDDIYKIQNYISEKSKYREALKGKTITPEIQKMANDFGIGDLNVKSNFDEFIERKAANTVKNNIPNYDMIGSLGQAVRKLPVGNFISFPIEIIRTGINTTRQGLKEIRTPGLEGIGARRLGGVFVFGAALGKGLEEGAQLAAGVSNESLNALKEYLPEWSKNSTLIPVKQNGEIYYIDFSHTNAYDVLTRPLNAAMNSFARAREEDQSVIGSFDDAAFEAGKEFLSPFVEESIVTSFFGDVLMRGGQTKDGRRIWNPEDDIGTKVGNTIKEALLVGSPGSIKQFERLYLSGTGSVDKYNRGYKFLNEATGLLGFRIQDPFVEDGLNFKIADNKRTVGNSKKLFTKVAYSPTSSDAEIIAAYKKANASKYENDQILFRRIEAAKQLGMDEYQIEDILKERYSKKEANALLDNEFTPIKVSDFVKQKISKNAEERGRIDPIDIIEFETDIIFDNLEGNSLFNNPEGLFKETINVIDDRTENVTSPKFEANSPTTTSSVPLPNIIPTISNNSGFILPSNIGTLNSGDRSQLAKSGNIDITEAIAERRT
tara:strand:+ start:735 stop:4919 length:4185 start_codon:yes stop_codon:yes gene_type:complete